MAKKRRPHPVNKTRPTSEKPTIEGDDLTARVYDTTATMYEDLKYNSLVAKGVHEVLIARMDLVNEINDSDQYRLVREHITNLIELTLDAYKSALRASNHLERISEMPTHEFTAAYKQTVKGMATKIRNDLDRYLGTMERGFVHLRADANWARKRERDAQSAFRLARRLDDYLDENGVERDWE